MMPTATRDFLKNGTFGRPLAPFGEPLDLFPDPGTFTPLAIRLGRLAYSVRAETSVTKLVKPMADDTRRSKDRRTSPAIGFTNFGGGATSKLVQPIADDARYSKDRQTSIPLGGASAVAGSQLCCALDI